MEEIDVILSGNISTTPRFQELLNQLNQKYTFRVLYLDRGQKWSRQDKDFTNLKKKSVAIYKGLNVGFVVYKCFQLIFGSMAEPRLIASLYKVYGKKNNNLMVFSSGGFRALPFISRIPVLVDVEDFYPGESTQELSPDCMKGWEMTTQTLPKISFSSEEFKRLSCSRGGFVIPNFFQFWKKKPGIERERMLLKLVWFGQVVSDKRGLQRVIPWIKNKPNLELHLIGELRPSIELLCVDGINIVLHGVLSKEKLASTLTQMDVGLSCELGENVNNQLLWSNKIAAYTQIGLPFLCTPTPGTRSFVSSFEPQAFFFEDQRSFALQLGIIGRNYLEVLAAARNKALSLTYLKYQDILGS